MACARKDLRFWRMAALGFGLAMLVLPSVVIAEQPSIDELKQRAAHASVSDRPGLCIHVAELQLKAADRFYVAGDSEKAQAALVDVVGFSEQAGDSSIQSHKHEKQSEIAIRKMAHKLADIKHTVSHDDQDQVQKAIDRLQRIRDDLLAAMFPKGVQR